MSKKKIRYFACDFETTVYEGQEYTEVWSSANLEFNEDGIIGKPFIFGSIKGQFDYFLSLKTNVIAYYHNLKFDGSFWIDFLVNVLKMKQAYKLIDTEYGKQYVFDKVSDMPSGTFKYTISELGQWYSIIIKKNNRVIELRDSLKLLPFSLRDIAKGFNTEHKKLEMEYKGFRYSGCTITEDERRYIENDVYVLAEALIKMFKLGQNKLTIGSCCLDEYKKTIGRDNYNQLFPDLTKIELDKERYKYKNADEYIRMGYRGGWCYVKPDKSKRVITKGVCVDVNSLYPSVMLSDSGNWYPVGKPYFWSGDYIPTKIINRVDRYYFIRVKTRFYLRKGFLPFIQIKHNYRFDGTENLITSDFYNKKTRCYDKYYYNAAGEMCDTRVELTFSKVDFELVKKHYILEDFEILDGCYFVAKIGLFDEYIEKYSLIKRENKGAKRTWAKLMLNNLYGKLASSTESSYKVAYSGEDKIINFMPMTAHEKKAGHIACGSAITSYARAFTITHAQENYKHFIYADTDSLHCNCDISELKNIKLHDTNFLAWKAETFFDKAIFVRQKTYIEHVTHENTKKLEYEYYNIKCAGMPEKCKKLLDYSLRGGANDEELNKYNDKEKEFARKSRTLKDFKKGLTIPGKLIPHRIRGGIILVDTYYTVRE